MASWKTRRSRALVGSRPSRASAKIELPKRIILRRAKLPQFRLGWRPKFLAVVALLVVGLVWYLQGPRFKSPPLPPMSVKTLPRERLRPFNLAPAEEWDELTADAGAAGAGRARPEMIWIAGGMVWLGSDVGVDGEQPRHQARLDPFWLDIHEVTNRQFAEFARTTGYVTAAERDRIGVVFDPASRRWCNQPNANWRRPDGLSPYLPNAPVAQVTWDDALAYAQWAGKRLPTEAEWECAARDGLLDCDFAWGRELAPQGNYLANFWQGWFPDEDLGLDGYTGVAPVRSFPASRYDLYDLVGNVWEWCADWHAADYYEVAARDNPTGPTRGSRRIIRGGSWLSAENSGRGLWVYGREGLAPAECRQDVGFRCARDGKGNRAASLDLPRGKR